ncbi:MAG: hypothetical protein ACK5NT_01465 [Pyrinomonadaceae bacterium]
MNQLIKNSKFDSAIVSAYNILKLIGKMRTPLVELINESFSRNEESSQALEIFEPFKSDFSQFDPELVWEYSAMGNHYEVLLFEEELTTSISICPNYHIPWALRNAIHPREFDFVIVNGYAISVMAVMQVIDEHLDQKNIREAILNHAIMKYEFGRVTKEEDKLYQPTESQMQIEFDRWRVQRGLSSIDSYNEYLQANGLIHEKIDAQIKDKRTYNNFLEALIHSPIEEYYDEHTEDFVLYKMESYVAQSEDEARELKGFLQDNPDGLCIWARKEFFSQTENAVNNYQLNSCRHYQLDEEVAGLLLENGKTGLLPPIEMNGKMTFVNILDIIPPTLDQQVESIIRQRQVQEWIDEKKKTLSIQWLWGDKDIFPNQNIQEV